MGPNAVYHDLAEPEADFLDDRWESSLASSYFSLSVRMSRSTPVAPGANYLRSVELDDLTVVELATTPCQAERNRRTRALDPDDRVALVMVQEGAERVETGGRRFSLSSGGAVFWDAERDTRFEVRRPVRKQNLLIPRSVLSEAVGRSVDTSVLVLDGPCVSVLTSYLPVLADSLPRMSSREVTGARNAALELLAGAIERSAGVPASARTELFDTVRRFVDRHLRSDVTPAAVARAHAISVRTLNRLFEDSGETFAGFVRRRRLERARDDLVATADPLGAVAHRWHFTDASHFSKRFTAHFGLPPSEYRRTRRSELVALTPAGPAHQN